MPILTRKQDRWFKPSWADVFRHAWGDLEWRLDETKPEPVYVRDAKGDLVLDDADRPVLTGDETVEIERVRWAETNARPQPSDAEIEAAAPAAWLVAAQRLGKSIVDRRAEGERLQHITPGDGMAMVYVEKLAEARAALASGGDGDFPLLAASGEKTVLDAARAVVVQADAWKRIAADIEARRLGAKRAIAAAADVDAVEAALVAGGWLTV